jgi:hypothetical protein
VLLAGLAPEGERDLVVLVAAEPRLRWREFSRAVAETWGILGGGPALLLGSFLAQVLHVGPVHLTGSGSTPHLGLRLRALGVAHNRYAGPITAIMPVYEALTSQGVECAHLWAAVPHYLPHLANPKGTLALVQVVARLLDLRLNVSDLERSSVAFEARLNAALTLPESPPTPPSDSPSGSPGALPTGEEAIQEVERLLGLEPGERGQSSS